MQSPNRISSTARWWRGWVIAAAAGGIVTALIVMSWGRFGSRPQPAEGHGSAVPDGVAESSPPTSHTLTALMDQRRQLDADVWSAEVEAQRYERPFTHLWDQLNRADDKWFVLRQLPMTKVRLRQPKSTRRVSSDVRRFSLDGQPLELDHAAWLNWIDRFQRAGYRIMQTEWHHGRFEPGVDDDPPRSEINFVLNLERTTEGERHRYTVSGILSVKWSSEAANPSINDVQLWQGEILVRHGPAAFEKVFTYSRRPTDYASAHPIILHDLNRDGRAEIVIGRWNRVYWNRGDGLFHEGRLFDHFIPHWECGIVADLTGDGAADYMTVDKQGRCVLFEGNHQGRFPSPPTVCASTNLTYPSAITAGDIDGDADLDLWVTQYRLSYEEGQMPTPYYDANDGYPAVLLQNNGNGRFVEITQPAGLAAKRNRRTYSTSFLDLDLDNDLDLMVVSDYAGVDLYRNDGRGQFQEVTQQLVAERHLFGMAHTVADYNLDGQIDLYVIGMSSTTARRLDRLKLGRADRPQVQVMRPAMGYGNRMYLGTADGFKAPAFAANVARTGWSWGTTSFDFDLDGDSDIYVANGFRTGRSTQDYCTRFWCHDLYTGNSQPNPVVESLFLQSLQGVEQQDISWNGYEQNALLLNIEGRDFVDAGFLMDVAAQYDSRAVVSDDLDGDGRPDLLVAEYSFAGRGFVLDLHVYRNVYRTNNHWIGVRLFGRENSPAPPGTVVRVRTAEREWIAHLVNGDSFLSQHADTLHFGLGRLTQVETIEVTWPGGQTQHLRRPEIDRYHDITFQDHAAR